MKKFSLILTFVLIWTTGLPCTCKFEGNFLKMSRHADLIVVVEMKDFSDPFILEEALPTKVEQSETITFNIIKTIKGQEERKEIKVFGDDGNLCRPSIRQFEKGKQYVIGLFKCQDYKRISGTMETVDNYYVSDCGAYWVDYSPSDKSVKGIINKKRKPTVMTLEKLEALLNED